MFNKITVLASIAVASGLAGSARADNGVDIVTIDAGGVRWSVTVPGFTTPFNYGTRTAQAYSVPYAVGARTGCFVLSDGWKSAKSNGWIPVGHPDGSVTVYPEFYSTWEGVVNNNATPSATVFSVQLEIQSGTTGAVNTQRKQVFAFQYNPEKIFFPTPSTTLYWGELDSSRDNPSVVQTSRVHQGDSIRVSICDLAAESTIDVRRIVVETTPGN